MTDTSSARAAAQRHRGSIFVEDARVLEVVVFPGDQYVLRLEAPETARRAVAGSFVHVQCDPAIPMRRPLSIMRANAVEGWIELLFKVIGAGLRCLGEKTTGDAVNLLGPIGNGFAPSAEKPRKLLIGGGVGIPPMIFLAEQLRQAGAARDTVVLMGSEIPFPFERVPSSIDTDWLEPSVNSAMPLLEDWGIESRLASGSHFEGTFRGYVTALAERWLAARNADWLASTEIFACGPTPMLRGVAALAARYGLPCQASLEEYMACAVGGCAGCTVLVQTPDGPAMKRVCVDGPVFDAATVCGFEIQAVEDQRAPRRSSQ